MESIHGHDVIHMIISSGRKFTRPELVDAIDAKFGTGARFHTCSAENLTTDQLIDFLQAKGKFLADEDGMTVDPSRVCQH